MIKYIGKYNNIEIKNELISINSWRVNNVPIYDI